jgi:hypothetical protein
MRQIADKAGPCGARHERSVAVCLRGFAPPAAQDGFARATEVAIELSAVVGLRKVAWGGKFHSAPYSLSCTRSVWRKVVRWGFDISSSWIF